jgi:secreted PhoX family phosphatase
MKLLIAAAVALALLVGATTAAAKKKPKPVQTDPAGILNLAAGYKYTVLAQTGSPQVRSTENGQSYPMPDDMDANVLVSAGHGDSWLLTVHELTKPVAGDFQGDALKSAIPELATTDDGDSDGWGSVTRLTLGHDGKTVKKAEVITTGLHDLCAGTLTPWRTFLVNEEFPFIVDPAKRSGWVWEVSPSTGKATRVAGMGWFSHEQEARLADGSWILSDDRGNFQFMYRFVPDDKRSLASGRLYALKYDRATNTGTWVGPLDPVNAEADAAAKIGSPNTYGFQKAEGVVATPNGQAVVFSESGSGSFAGAVWKLTPTATGASGSVLVQGDFASLSRPDNLRFTRAGDLMIAEDNGSALASANGGYNELRILPKGKTGAAATVVFAVVGGGGEPTGPWFSTNHKILYLSLQDVNDKSYTVAVTGEKSFAQPYAR